MPNKLIRVIVLSGLLTLGFAPQYALTPASAQGRGTPAPTGFMGGGNLLSVGSGKPLKTQDRVRERKRGGGGGGSASHGAEPVSLLLFGAGLGVMKLRNRNQ